MRMVEWRALCASVRTARGQIHLMQRDARGICGRKAPPSRLVDDINTVTCLDCQSGRMQIASINELLRHKGRYTKQQGEQ